MPRLSRLQVRTSAAENPWADIGHGSSEEKLPAIFYANTAKDRSGTDYVPLVDSDGHLQIDVLSGGGAGTQYTEDAAAPADPVGGTLMMTRDDQLGTVTEAEGDWSRLRGTAKGALWVALADASGDPITAFGGGTEYTEDVVTANPQVGKAIVVERDDALSAVTPAEGDWIGLRGTAEGALWVQDFNSDTIVADTTAIKTAIQLIDNAVDGNYLNVNANIAGTDFVGGAGAVAAGVQRVTLASDDPAVVDLAAIEVLLTGIDADTNAIKTAVELLDNSVDGNYLNVNANIAGTDFVGGAGAVAAGVQRITLASDDPGVALLTTIDSDTNTIQSDTTAIKTAVQIMDDWDNVASDGASVSGDVAHDGADAGEPVKIGGKAQEQTGQLEEVADNDRVNAALDRQGRVANWMGYPVQSAIINDSNSGDNTIQAAAGAGLRIALIGCVIISDGTTDVRWEDGAGGTAFTGQMPLQAREGFVMPIGPQPWFVGSANTLLNLELTAAINVHGIASFVVMTD